jgi:hypothetical protein
MIAVFYNINSFILLDFETFSSSIKFFLKNFFIISTNYKNSLFESIWHHPCLNPLIKKGGEIE